MEALLEDAQLRLWWIGAAKHHNGKGAEQGIDVRDTKKHLEALMKKGEHQLYGGLLAAACAGTWPKARRCEEFGEADHCCECGEKEDDLHRIWGDCEERQDKAILAKTQGLEGRARGTAESVPIF